MSHPNANNNLLPIEIQMIVKSQTQLLKGNDSKKSEEKIDTSLKAYKSCGEIGHIAKEYPDEWPHCDTNYPTE